MPRIRTRYLAVYGDGDPIENGGGYLVRRSGGGLPHPVVTLETVDWWGVSGPGEGLLYRVDIPDDVAVMCDWADLAPVVRAFGMQTPADWHRLATSSDVVDRAYALALVADYHGWDNLDSYPETVTRADIRRRWRPRNVPRRGV